ncbi:uncharacterized protein LOC124256205 [Haliotis rubra]|uniref:uncharacterized protein LOC124256205 n=1 Tax=Haliotis rubra TaxID=36100 RepID=UPI001EE5528A|nr:uncharacterized protein LOC124256205 [Haliotis rubra]
MATPTPQILTSVSIETNEYTRVLCTVQITVPVGSSLKLNFTSVINPNPDPIEIYRIDPSVSRRRYVGVSMNIRFGYGPPIYVFSGSVYVGIEYDVLPSTTFIMEYQEVAFEENICTLMPLLQADTTVREIVTPNFGNGPYFDNEECQVTIQSNVPGASEVKVEVTFHVMECDYDTITICDGVFCHNLCRSNPGIFRGTNVLVRLSSDFVYAKLGMRLEYITDLSDWTSWVSTGCHANRNCDLFVNDTRRRNCLIDICMDEPVQERTRVCSTFCADCLLP